MLVTRAQKRAGSDGRILDAAAKVFGSQGYSKATLARIAEEAGVSQGLVSQRFGSKENLLNEVFEQTQILSFYNEESQHLPQAFFTLLDHLKQEVSEEPEWFSFLNMIHTGTDTPESFEKCTKDKFNSTPLRSAIEEAQNREDLPFGDPWDIFRVFFRNATNLIGWYHEFGLPMPENSYFLYAIQYSFHQKETEAKLESQKCAIQTLKADRDILCTAISDIYPLIIFGNLTKNTYSVLECERFPTKRALDEKTYDELVNSSASTIPVEIHREQFLRLFSREALLQAYQNGKRQLNLRLQQVGDDGIIRWVETRVIIRQCDCGGILTISFSRPVNDEMERLLSYSEALQKADLAAGTSSRFLTNLSHAIRTPMSTVIGYTELLKRHPEEAEKVLDYANKMSVSEKELMDMISQALDAAHLSMNTGGNMIRLSISESSNTILSNAVKLADQRNVKLSYQLGHFSDNYIYTNEILLQRAVMGLFILAINESFPEDTVQVTLDQLPDPDKNLVQIRLSIHDSGVEMNDALLRKALDESPKAEGIQMDLARIREELHGLGGTLQMLTGEEGNTYVCLFRFHRADQ